MEAREAEDVVNDYGRDPVGEGKEERVSHLLHLEILRRPTDLFLSRNITVNSKLFSITEETMYLLQQRLAKTPLRV